MKTKEDDILGSARRRLIDEMAKISHEDEAGRVLKDVVTSTATLIPLFVSEFIPEADAEIYSKERMRQLLMAFGDQLLQSQADWAARWNKRRG